MIETILKEHATSLCHTRSQMYTEGNQLMTCVAFNKKNPYNVLQCGLQLLPD